MAKKKQSLSNCPSNEGCSAGNPNQRALTDGECKKLPQESWVARATRCSWCGTVYTQELTGVTIHGYLDNKWHPRIHRD